MNDFIEEQGDHIKVEEKLLIKGVEVLS